MSAHLITLKCGLTDPGARPDTGALLRDAVTSRMPSLWSGARTDVRLLFENPITGTAVNTADWALVTFRLLGSDRATLYAYRNIDPDDFLAGPPKESTVELTTTETTRETGEYWLAVFATLVGGGLLPLYAGPLKVDNGGLTTTTPAEPEDEPVYTQAQIDALFGPGTGGIYAAGGSGFLDVAGMPWTWPVASLGAGAGVGLTVLDGSALLTYAGQTCTWPVTEITAIPGAPLTQILDGSLVITIGGRSYSNPAAPVP